MIAGTVYCARLPSLTRFICFSLRRFAMVASGLFFFFLRRGIFSPRFLCFFSVQKGSPLPLWLFGSHRITNSLAPEPTRMSWDVGIRVGQS